MAKVGRTKVFFKKSWFVYAKGPSMRHPGNEILIAFLRKNVMHLLSKRHAFEIGFGYKSRNRWNVRKVSIRMVHGTFDMRNDLYHNWFDWVKRLVGSSRTRRFSTRSSSSRRSRRVSSWSWGSWRRSRREMNRGCRRRRRRFVTSHDVGLSLFLSFKWWGLVFGLNERRDDVWCWLFQPPQEKKFYTEIQRWRCRGLCRWGQFLCKHQGHLISTHPRFSLEWSIVANHDPFQRFDNYRHYTRTFCRHLTISQGTELFRTLNDCLSHVTLVLYL